MKVFITLATLLVSVMSFAQGQRYMMAFKTSADLKQVKQAIQLKDMNYKGFQFKGGNLMAVAQPKVVKSFDHVNTLVLNIPSDKMAEALKALPGVVAIEKEVMLPAPKFPKFHKLGMSSATTLPGKATPWGIMTVKAPQAWTTSHHGKGARVLVLDTGIDKNHPALAANFEQAKDFVEDGHGYEDMVGHGSHVAGTIAGAMNEETGFVGVAPEAKILAGRVCGLQGCSNVDIVAGINWGIAEKVDVINMSLGGSCLFSRHVTQEAAERAEAAGVTVVAASGNDAEQAKPGGRVPVSCPAAHETVVAVGALEPNLQRAKFSQYGPELDVMAPGVDVSSAVPVGTGREAKVEILVDDRAQGVNATAFVGSKFIPVPVEGTLVYAGLGKPEDFAKVDVKGKFALIQRGEIAFVAKYEAALAAGATGVVIFNNVPGIMQGTLLAEGDDESKEREIPAMMIEQSTGEAIRTQLAASKVVNARMVTMATDYASFQGTSMASPHVAGVAALVKATNPKLTPLQVRNILKDTAQNIGATLEYGAGLVNAEAAVNKAAGK